jgi:hypothetical protein
MSGDFNEMASRLFGDTTPTAQVDHGVAFRAELGGAAPLRQLPDYTPSTDAELADSLYGDSDPELLYGDSMRSIESAVLEQLGDPAEAAVTAAQWASDFQTLGLTHADAMAITEVGISAISTPPTPETVLTWQEEARTALLQDWGPRGAHQALADAKTFITRFGTPELRDVLNMTGLGNHPQVVRVIAAKARQARLEGRLR